MIRALALAAILALSAPASAQTDPTANVTRASQALSFLWRPIPALDASAITAACAGAAEEIDAVEAALPPVLTTESLSRVRALHGLLIIPTEDPAISYFFPDGSMPWFASGLGGVAVLNEGEGFIGVRDAGGRQMAFQLGRAGGRPILRIRNPDDTILNFVGCAPTFPAS
jgi:hypothetical protein